MMKKEKKQELQEGIEYKWFESHNPLKKERDLFPWMAQNEKRKSKHSKPRKAQ